MLRDGVYRIGGNFCIVKNGEVLNNFKRLDDLQVYVRNNKILLANKVKNKKRSKRRLSILEKKKLIQNLKKAWRKTHTPSAERKRMHSNRKRVLLSDSLVSYLKNIFDESFISILDLNDSYIFYFDDEVFYINDLEEVFDCLCEIL